MSTRMMILQGVGHLMPFHGVYYANDPPKGGFMAPAPVLDLITLFEVILKFFQMPLNSLTNVKTAKSSPTRGRMEAGGGGGRVTGRLDPGPLRLVRGSTYKKKFFST